MLVSLAEAQADKMQDDMLSLLQSEEVETQIATAINKKINIPFVKESDEQKLFEQVVDVVTDVITGIFRK